MLGEGLAELKFQFGSGCRIYFSEFKGEIILLLCTGDKGSQAKDIKIARAYLEDFLRGNNHD
jgi:putative addiction module killer protein